jgi:integrase
MRIPQPWLRKATKTWHVQLDGKQVKLGKDKTEAFRKYAKLMAERGEGIRDTDYTARDIIDLYWEWMKGNRAATTCDNRKPLLISFSESLPELLKATQVKPHHVDRWLKPEYSSATKSSRIALVVGVFNWAVRFGYLQSNPIAKMPKPTVTIREEFVPAELWGKVLSLATDQPFLDYLTVMLASGARAQEMRIFEAKHLHGNRLILPIADSKGRKKSRVVYLPEDALAIVKRLAVEHPIGELFQNSEGRPWTKDAVNCRFRRLKRLLKMPKLCATVLRHSFAHYRLTSGQDALTLSKLMGHTDTRMLAQRYGHLDANVDYLAAAANSIAFPALPSAAPSPTV